MSALSRIVLLSFSEEPDLVVFGFPSEAFACFILVPASSWIPTRLEIDNVRGEVECLRAFFLTSVPWLCLRGFESPWAGETEADCVDVDEAVDGILGGRARPCKYVSTEVSESFRWGCRRASTRCFGSLGSRDSLGSRGSLASLVDMVVPATQVSDAKDEKKKVIGRISKS